MRRSLPFVGLLVALTVSACRPHSSSAAADASPPPANSTTAPPSAPAAPPPDAHLTQSFSGAGFTSDVLTECSDWTARIVPSEDAGTVTPEAAKTYFVDLWKNVAKGITPSSEPCAKAFADKVELASCASTMKGVTAKKGGHPVEMTMLAHYYDYATLSEDDAFRKDCMSVGGKWTQVPSDSDVWLKARHVNTRKKLEKLTR